MAPHDREEYRQRMGHVWLGFSDDQLRRLLDRAGFASVRITPLPPFTDAKGPGLVAAVARRRDRPTTAINGNEPRLLRPL